MSDTITSMGKTFSPLKWAVIPLAAICALLIALPANADDRHTVSPGETLLGIAARYGIDVSAIAERNGINNVNLVVAGQTLLIPGAGGGQGGASAPPEGHRIGAGETLTSIAARYGLSIAVLTELNNLVNPNHIVAGQLLQLPGQGGSTPEPPATGQGAAGSHTVAAGDTLTSIAARYGVSVSALAAENNISNPNRIITGQQLSIPGGGTGGHSQASIEQWLIQAEQEFGLPAGLMRAVAMQESGWQQHVVSSAGAIGVMQLMPGTANWLVSDVLPGASDWRNNPRDNIRLGAALLNRNLVAYGGDLDYALAAYYQGDGNITRFGIFDETWHYIANVRALMERYR